MNSDTFQKIESIGKKSTTLKLFTIGLIKQIRQHVSNTSAKSKCMLTLSALTGERASETAEDVKDNSMR